MFWGKKCNDFVCIDGQMPAATDAIHLGDIIKIDIKKNKLLGKGKFGSVFEYTFKGTKVAVKRLLILDWDEALDEAAKKREGNAMTNLIHDNVLRLIGEQEDDDFK